MQQLVGPVTSVAVMAMMVKLLTRVLSGALMPQTDPIGMSLAEIHEEMRRISEAEMSLTERKAWRADTLTYLSSALMAVRKRNRTIAIQELKSAIIGTQYYRVRYPEARDIALSIDFALQHVYRNDWARAEAIIDQVREKTARGILAAERETEAMQKRYSELDRARRVKLSRVLRRRYEEDL